MLIERNKSIIPACDIDYLSFIKLLHDTSQSEYIETYKVGITLFPKLEYVVAAIHGHNKKVIFDMQKAGNDIPDMGYKFARMCSSMGIDAVILFPFTGKQTAREWIRACIGEGVHVIVGGIMTHPGFFDFIRDYTPYHIYEIAIEEGIKDFVLPGNHPDSFCFYRDLIEDFIDNPVYYSPGLIAQGGDISETGKIAGDNWHCIIGRGLYQSEDVNKTLEKLGEQL